jgi:RNA polymerase sigma-70 factor (ECF subfamily)
MLHALRREPEAAGLVYDRYALRLVRYLQQQGASEEAALDATQETFARLIVHRRRVSLADDGSLWPWLAVTGRNLLRDWQRRGIVEARARRRLRISIEPDESADALTRLDADREQASLRLALERLPAEQRAAVNARVVEERDYPEIARASDTTEETVRSRVSRGLRAMQTFLPGGNS